MAKFLCICDGGNVRSAGLAFVLKYECQPNHEAIAIGRLNVSAETMEMLCNWADRIVIMQPRMEESVPKKFKKKTRCVDVGEDVFGVYVHPELLKMVRHGAVWLTAEVGRC